jgi:hypothetical protein
MQNALSVMKKKEKLPEWIDRYHDGTLGGEELQEFLQLLENDPALQEEVLADRLIQESLEDTDLLEFRKALQAASQNREQGRRLPGWLLLAASVLAVLGLALGYVMLPSNTPQPVLTGKETSKPAHDTASVSRKPASAGGQGKREDAAADPSRSAEQETNLLAQNYRSLPSLESLVGEVVRETGFRLLEPGVKTTLKQGTRLHFSWKASSGMTLRLELLNNLGKRVLSWTFPGSGEQILDTSELGPGLYYFRFSSTSGLLTVGKLIILSH